MAYPSLDELLKAYQMQTSGLGDTLGQVREGVTQGTNLASLLQQRQAQNDLRKQQFAEKVKEFQQNEEIKKQLADAAQEKANTGGWKTVGQTPEGYLIQENSKTGEQKITTTKAAPGLGKGVNTYADIRAKGQLSTSILNDPNYRQNLSIIDKGLRIQNLGNAKDVVQNPTQLHILNDLIVSQAEGGKASLAGVQKAGNETAQQYAARVLEKITNQPESADTQKFIDQIKALSEQDMKSAYTSIDSLAKAKGSALAKVYPDYAKSIQDTANDFASDYVKGLYGGKTPDFIKDTGDNSTSANSSQAPTTPIKTADDFLKKYGLQNSNQ